MLRDGAECSGECLRRDECVACGDPQQDLPPWVQQAISCGGTLRSVAMPASHVAGVALQLLAHRAFCDAFEGMPGGPSRVWSFLPRITDPDEDGLNRYMRMNIGRAEAYADGIAADAPPAGTGVGHAGDALVVHALHMPGIARPIENPRQRPAWRYSEKFGPCPPPFARATAIGNWVFASGTAAVVGEESVHAGDPIAQWSESLVNLAVLAEASGLSGGWDSMRVYASTALVRDAIVKAMSSAQSDLVERVLVVPLCRAELLVEVEAVRRG